MACIWIIFGRCNELGNLFYCGDGTSADPNVYVQIGWVKYDELNNGFGKS